MITLTGNFEALTGSGNGYVILTLINYGTNIPRLYGGGVIVNPTYQTSPGANFSVNLWGNDAITPANTYYQVSFYGAGQSLIATEIYQFNGSGTFDLSEVTPIVVTASVPLGLAAVAYSGSYTDLSNRPGSDGVLVTSPYSGDFSVAHGLGRTPTTVVIQMTCGGLIWFQSPLLYDSTNLYLVASDIGVTATASCF
jgi:hypothetical protein